MLQINKRLTSFVWYAAPLSLSGSFGWKSRIVTLRVINPAGAGYVSYDPSRPANSLTTLATGAVVTLDAKGITAGTASTYFNLDNGAAPTGGVRPNPVARLLRSLATEGLTTANFLRSYLENRPTAITVDAPDGVSVQLALNGGAALSTADALAAFSALSDATIAAGVSLDYTLIKPVANVEVAAIITFTF